MKKISKAGVSIIEAIVLILIISFAVIGVYKLYNESSKLSESSKNRIQAIQIAREGIEAVTNIRDTNWLLLGADPNNCWVILDYKENCIGNDIIYDYNNSMFGGKFILYKKNDHKWYLKNLNISNLDFDNKDYRDKFLVFLDDKGFYNQNDSSKKWTSSDFTREIRIEKIFGNGKLGDSIEVTSIVQWHDGLLGTSRKIELSQILTNWQKKNN